MCPLVLAEIEHVHVEFDAPRSSVVAIARFMGLVAVRRSAGRKFIGDLRLASSSNRA